MSRPSAITLPRPPPGGTAYTWPLQEPTNRVPESAKARPRALRQAGGVDLDREPRGQAHLAQGQGLGPGAEPGQQGGQNEQNEQSERRRFMALKILILRADG